MGLRTGQIYWHHKRLAFATVWRRRSDYALVNVLKREGGTPRTEAWPGRVPAGWSLYYQPRPVHLARATSVDTGLDVEGWFIANNGRAHWFRDGSYDSACGSVLRVRATRKTYSPGESWPCATCVGRANAEAERRKA